MPSTKSSKITQAKLPCPLPDCGSSDAYHLYDDGHGYCFSCNKSYFPDKGFEDLNTFTYEHLPWRGIDKPIFSFYDVKTKIDHEGAPVSIGFKYPNGMHKVRSLKEKDFRWVGDGDVNKAGLFGEDKFGAGSHKCVTITEGEFDALSLYQVIRSPVVSVHSASSAVRDCTHSRSWLNSFERIYLAFDNDAHGADAVRHVAKLFDYNKIYVVKFSNRKDANEYLQAGESNELLNIWNNAKHYMPENIRSSLSEFGDILSLPKKWGIEYPWPTLTRMTYGMRTGETVLIKAQEKVGKTELMHAILHQLLKVTDDNVGALFLEEPEQRLLQALAGIELKQPVHLPDCPVPAHKAVAAIGDVVGRDGRLHVYSHFGSDDPGLFLDTIRFLATARACRWVLLDHISMVVSGLLEGDERRSLDYFSTRLEMLVKDLDFGLIMVSHVNDFGQTRGSRYLTKVADITIDAARDTLAIDPIARSTIKLTIPFNRFCGYTGEAGNILYNQDTYSLTEVANENFEPNRPSSMAA